MASTEDYLVKKIQAHRRRLARLFQDLKNTSTTLADGFDPQFSLDDQGDVITGAAGDLGQLMLEILEVGAQIVALEGVPRVG